jgi:hypothetical protein
MAFSSLGAKLCEQLLPDPDCVSLILEYAAYPVHPCTDQLRCRASPHLHDLIHGVPLWMSRGLNVTMWIGGYNLAPHTYVDYDSIY